MKVELPQHTHNRTRQSTSDLRTLTIIGANGAGKSRFGDDIACRYSDRVFRISALKALFIAPEESKIAGNNITRLYNELQTKTTYKIEAIDTEFERLMYLLMYEEFVNVIAYKQNENKQGRLPRTKLDQVQQHWEKIFPRNKMLRMSGKLSIVGEKDAQPYAPTRLSDGEKTVLYLLASVLYADKNGIVMVEDPEVFLHHSIMKSVWDTVEDLRPDCTFIYLTHDLEFAASRNESTCVWVKQNLS